MLPIKVIRSTPAAGINRSIRSCIRGNTSLLKSNIFTTHNSSCGKVMFSQASVFFGGGGGVGGIGISHAPWTYLPPWHTLPTCYLHLVVISGQTCSLKALIPPTVLKFIGRYWSRWLASYWNAFLSFLRPYISLHYSKWKHVPSLLFFFINSVGRAVTIFD